MILALPEHYDGFVEVIPRCQVCGRIKSKPTAGLQRHLFCVAETRRLPIASMSCGARSADVAVRAVPCRRLAVYLAGLCDYKDKRVRGEKGVVLLLAPDMRQAKVSLDYAAGVLESTPIMRQLFLVQLQPSSGSVAGANKSGLGTVMSPSSCLIGLAAGRCCSLTRRASSSVSELAKRQKAAACAASLAELVC
jgi:hypothetical protein